MPNALRGSRSRSSIAALGLALTTVWGTWSPAFAAAETEVVPFLHWKAGVGFRGQKVQGQYFQNDARIGARDEIRNFVDIHGRFGAWYGLEAYFDTSYDTWDRVKWESINFGGTPPSGGDDQQERRKGMADTRIGVRYAVLSEARNQGDVSTWTVETNVKIPGTFSIYPELANTSNPTVTEAGAGTPGFEWLLKTSFSKRVRFAEPYVSFFYQHRASASLPSEGVGNFDLPDMWGTFFGTEIVGFERKADDLKFSADIGVGWRFVNEGEVPANRFFYGPDRNPILPAIGGNVVREQRHIRYDARLGFYYQLQKHAQAIGHLTYGLPTEHYIEVYPTSFSDPQGGGRVRNREFTDFGYHFTMVAVF